MNNDFQRYNLIADLGGSATNFKVIIDTANSVYNNTMWRSMTDVKPASLSKSFTTLEAETGIIVKASNLGSMSKKPLRSFEGAAQSKGSIPKIGHGFKFDQADMNHLDELNLVDTNYATYALSTYTKRAETIIGGFHATWNGWVYEALSNQAINLKDLGGADDIVDLNVPSSHKLKAKGTKGWFEAATDSKIVDDLVRMDKTATDVAKMPSARVYVCSKVLFDKIVNDPQILARIKATMPFATADTFINPKRIAELIPQVFGIPPIVPIDEASRHEVNGIPILSPSAFNTDKISLIPTMTLFDMYNSPSDYMKDQNSSTIKSFTEGGLIGSIQKYESDPIQIVTNFESYSFLTFKNSKWIVSLNSALASATGN